MPQIVISSVPILPGPARYSVSISCCTCWWFTIGFSSLVPVKAMLNMLLVSDGNRYNAPFSLHAEIAANDGCQVLIEHLFERLLEQVNLLIRATEQNLVQQILVRARALGRALDQVRIPVQGSVGEADQTEFEPGVSAVGKRHSPSTELLLEHFDERFPRSLLKRPCKRSHAHRVERSHRVDQRIFVGSKALIVSIRDMDGTYLCRFTDPFRVKLGVVLQRRQRLAWCWDRYTEIVETAWGAVAVLGSSVCRLTTVHGLVCTIRRLRCTVSRLGRAVARLRRREANLGSAIAWLRRWMGKASVRGGLSEPDVGSSAIRLLRHKATRRRLLVVPVAHRCRRPVR